MSFRCAYLPRVTACRVPTAATVRLLVDLLSRFGYDEIFLPAAPFDAEAFRGFALYAEMKGVALVPVPADFAEGLRAGGLSLRAGVGFYACGDLCTGGALAGRVEEMRRQVEEAYKTAVAGGVNRLLFVEDLASVHLAPLAAVLPGLILGGAFAQEGLSAARMNLEESLDVALGVPLGGTLLKLGTLYLRGGALHPRETELFRILTAERGYSRSPKMTAFVLAELSAIAEGCRHQASAFVSQTRFGPSSVWAEEIMLMANLVDAACNRRDIRRLDFLRAEYARVWRLRFREEGLSEMLACLPRF